MIGAEGAVGTLVIKGGDAGCEPSLVIGDMVQLYSVPEVVPSNVRIFWFEELSCWTVAGDSDTSTPELAQ